jgi:hypothetical protein
MRTLGDEGRVVDDALSLWRATLSRSRKNLNLQQRRCLMFEILGDTRNEIATLTERSPPRYGGRR